MAISFAIGFCAGIAACWFIWVIIGLSRCPRVARGHADELAGGKLCYALYLADRLPAAARQFPDRGFAPADPAPLKQRAGLPLSLSSSEETRRRQRMATTTTMSDKLTITPPAAQVRIPGPVELTNAQRHAIGGYAIETMRQRLGRFEGLTDTMMRPYSARGPVYAPVFGAGRSKASLGGVFGLSSKDVKAMYLKGTADVKLRGRRGFQGPNRKGVPLATQTRSRKSMKFSNRAAYKRALGKSGNRDLEESGRMLNAITIVENTRDHITLGFSREEEHQKALGNQALAPWFGLSSRDIATLTPFVAEQCAAAVIASLKKVTL